MSTLSGPYLETPEVLRLCKLPYSSLDYWVRTGLITPTVRAGEGRRRTRLWSVLDVVCVRALKELRDAGAPVRLLTSARQALQADWASSLRDRTLFWDGGDVVRIDEWDNVVSIARAPGQSVVRFVALQLNVFQDEVEARVAELRPDNDFKRQIA